MQPAFALMVLAGLACAGGARAAVFQHTTFFTGNDRSVWSGGPGFAFDTGDRFLGVDWDKGGSVGSIATVCLPFPLDDVCAKAGAKLGAETRGAAGLAYRVRVDSGTFDVQYPGTASFDVPTSYSGSGPIRVDIGSRFDALPSISAPTSPGGPLVTRNSQLQVDGPTGQAYLDLKARLFAEAGAEVCVGICYGPKFGPVDFDKSRTIASINRDNDGLVRVLDEVVGPNRTISGFGGLLNASLNIPNLDSSSAATPGGFDGRALTSTRRDRIGVLNANVAQIAANALGLPIPLSGRVGPIGYNLLQANLGAGLDLEQTLTFTPEVRGAYFFSRPVQPIVNGILQPLARDLSFNFGDTVSFQSGDNSLLGIIPRVIFGGTLRNQTSLVIGGNVDVKALGLDVAGLTLGPIIDQRLGSGDIGRFTLFDETFSTGQLGFTDVSPIRLQFAGCDRRTGGREFFFVDFCASSEYVPTFLGGNGDGTYNAFYNERFCPAYRANQDTIRNPRTCFEFGPIKGGARVFDGVGAYIGDRGSAFAYDPITPGVSMTDDDLARDLAGLPDVGGREPFVIPRGRSYAGFAEVPEPVGSAVLALGVAALALAWRRRA